ncbi:1-deoxy-D-xylulose-5-phosphate reductoisomerase [Ignatzschineria rhizosphaerae]|uniref:1-deoxy-D-xylulose 5-phosphate reductoisomerase n=1 Tax=Ignatzschineria rhizosphaerae TaxID=2923279 RepID=A0ABY3WX43_9GAMM|nr:1-deoxy-D-xylulose-5-phosphate reductoisomerase [Ignatzschineria rhizosphaerae]UNM95171.1 1-deoxy-D-xylulose-5-phosphate reductoisomerase [Ignatzschineria rhizosphaerae]
MKQISILGATGSIGDSTLKVIRNNRDLYQIHSLVAHKSVEKMFALCEEFNPRYAILEDEAAALLLKERVKAAGLNVEVEAGESAVISLVKANEIDLVVAAIVGAKGFLSSLSAARAGKTILLANKETLVVGGALFMQEAKKFGATILPIDSEHNALFQSLPKNIDGTAGYEGVKQLILTASGGPFRGFSREQLEKVTLEQALKHPNWAMGAKVTIDSATLMNKGLEFIEAHFLFEMPVDKIQVVVHPQSMIHSLVEYIDGSLISQMGAADMAIPIAHALAYPQRVVSGAKSLDLTKMSALTFEAPDLVAFPALQLAKESLIAGASHLVALNAANEVFVEQFLQKKIRFVEIADKLAKVLDGVVISNHALQDEASLLAYDQSIREIAQHI